MANGAIIIPSEPRNQGYLHAQIGYIFMGTK